MHLACIKLNSHFFNKISRQKKDFTLALISFEICVTNLFIKSNNRIVLLYSQKKKEKERKEKKMEKSLLKKLKGKLYTKVHLKSYILKSKEPFPICFFSLFYYLANKK